MPYYAQLNEAGRVVAVVETSSPLEGASNVLLDSLDESILGHTHADGEFTPPAPVPVRRLITRLAFDNRFTQAESVALEIAQLDDPAASMPARQAAAALRASQRKVDRARYIDLDRPDTRAGVEALETAGLLAAGRALEILDDEIEDAERYTGGRMNVAQLKALRRRAFWDRRYNPKEVFDFTTGSRAGLLLGTPLTVSGGANGTVVNASDLVVSASAPRITFDPTTGRCLGLLVEPARTNLIDASEDISTWSAGLHTVTANTTTAPSGATTADTVDPTVGAVGFVLRAVSKATSAITYTASFFLKPLLGSSATVFLTDNVAGEAACTFNVSAGTKGTPRKREPISPEGFLNNDEA